MTYIATLQATIQKWADDALSCNADLARAELKTALGTIAHLERCYSAPDAVK